MYIKQTTGETEQEPNKEEAEAKAEGEDNDKKSFHKKFIDMDEADIKVEGAHKLDPLVDLVFSKKIALALLAVDWKYKEIALKIIYKQAEKQLDMQMKADQQ